MCRYDSNCRQKAYRMRAKLVYSAVATCVAIVGLLFCQDFMHSSLKFQASAFDTHQPAVNILSLRQAELRTFIFGLCYQKAFYNNISQCVSADSQDVHFYPIKSGKNAHVWWNDGDAWQKGNVLCASEQFVDDENNAKFTFSMSLGFTVGGTLLYLLALVLLCFFCESWCSCGRYWRGRAFQDESTHLLHQ